MTKVDMTQEKNGRWTVTVEGTVQISGFSSDREAAVWVFEYTKHLLDCAMRLTKQKEKREEKRKLIGAAILELPNHVQ